MRRRWDSAGISHTSVFLVEGFGIIPWTTAGPVGQQPQTTLARRTRDWNRGLHYLHLFLWILVRKGCCSTTFKYISPVVGDLGVEQESLYITIWKRYVRWRIGIHVLPRFTGYGFRILQSKEVQQNHSLFSWPVFLNNYQCCLCRQKTKKRTKRMMIGIKFGYYGGYEGWKYSCALHS